MSATFEVYKIRPDVEYLSSPFYNIVYEKGWKYVSEVRENQLLREMLGPEGSAELGLENVGSDKVFSDEQLFGLYNDCFEDKFSKPGNFQVLLKQDIGRIGKVRKSVMSFDNWLERKGLYKSLRFPCGTTIKYVTVECLRHEQGFYFKTKRWIRNTKGITTNYYKSKRGMVRFFNRFIRMNNETAFRAFTNLCNIWDSNQGDLLFFRAGF